MLRAALRADEGPVRTPVASITSLGRSLSLANRKESQVPKSPRFVKPRKLETDPSFGVEGLDGSSNAPRTRRCRVSGAHPPPPPRAGTPDRSAARSNCSGSACIRYRRSRRRPRTTALRVTVSAYPSSCQIALERTWPRHSFFVPHIPQMRVPSHHHRWRRAVETRWHRPAVDGRTLRRGVDGAAPSQAAATIGTGPFGCRVARSSVLRPFSTPTMR